MQKNIPKPEIATPLNRLMDLQFYTQPGQDVDPEETLEEIEQMVESFGLDGYRVKTNRAQQWERGNQIGIWYVHTVTAESPVVISYVSAHTKKQRDRPMLFGERTGIGHHVDTIRVVGNSGFVQEMREEYEAQFMLRGYTKATTKEAKKIFEDPKKNPFERLEYSYYLMALEFAKGPLSDNETMARIFSQGEQIWEEIENRSLWKRMKGVPREAYIGCRLIAKELSESYRRMETKVRSINKQ